MSDIPELSGRNWLVYAYRSRNCVQTGESPGQFFTPEGGAELFLLIPDGGRDRLIGILEKYISCGRLRILHEEEKPRGGASFWKPVRLELRRIGRRSGWIDGRDHEAVCHGGMLWSVTGKPDCLVEIGGSPGGL